MYYEMPEYTGPFRDAAIEYIELKRSLGYDYGITRVNRLREIDLFLKAHGATGAMITEDMFEAWVARRANEGEQNRRNRASILIAFSKYLAKNGHKDIFIGELPARRPPRTFVPYIYTKSEILRLFETVRACVAVEPENHEYVTFAVLLLLYYGCGLRKMEAQNLLMRDIDFDSGRIRIMDSKNHISRLVVVADSVRRQLVAYRDRFCFAHDDHDHFFRLGNGPALSDSKLYRMYHQAQDRAAIKPRENGRMPRIHDIRHTFCVHTLEAMTEKGFGIYTTAPLLVRFLGHKSLSETEYYLRLVSEGFKSVTEKSKGYAPDMFPKVGGTYVE